MFSERTKASLSLYLSLHDPGFLRILFERHNITIYGYLEKVDFFYNALHSSITSASPEQLSDLLNHMIKTSWELRSRISPRYRHDDRWNDLIGCLMLDGYTVDDNKGLVQVDPSIEDVGPMEDEFTRELRRSDLAEVEKVIELMKDSAEDFRKVPPDYIGCLVKARVALETLARSIAWVRHSASYSGTYDETKWGSVLTCLKSAGLINEDEEKGLAGVYRFVSSGAHKPLGLSEQEMARLGRSLVSSMCYFLIKLYNNKR